ncbi:MBL fold metallo-hydrolase [Aureimonas jatrophae]|uniref:Phosphoribosyl 1,2-cyclic phosphodiesterase n=1 Tax=Aureimonas jatrophae TaxID=1166073 RepID=A0A1H0EVE2_9HYPH|nr:MBL fold metallo-hydrolase [Aureimonas jatrophae]MBB3950296.1 phosphoribosyl 1,2-cyclic phosphodiesterase [Aureimonas jatrophae]SDN86342.1 Phosphoribosyl 1,2-cyclic phosphodiesterase [Aureimonas jatrophae]
MTHAPAGLRLEIWGARGTLPVAPDDPSRFGAKTCCVSAEAGDRVLIFDAGTGIVPLGNRLHAEKRREIDLFLGHAHYDHVMGLPYFAPFYDPSCRVRIHAGHMQDGKTCRELLVDFLRPPFHPVGLEKFKAEIDYVTFHPGDRLAPAPGVAIETAPLRHPNGAVAYRVETGHRSIVYATDHEHLPGTRDETLERFLAGADLLVYDTTYTDAEMPLFKGYGHSSVEEGIRLCRRSGIERLVLFHHSHKRSDADLARIEAQAQADFPGAVAGRPGLCFDLAPVADRLPA